MSPHKTRFLGLVEGGNLTSLTGKMKFLACALGRRIGECVRKREHARGRRHASAGLLKLARPVCYSGYGIFSNKLKTENLAFKDVWKKSG